MESRSSPTSPGSNPSSVSTESDYVKVRENADESDSSTENVGAVSAPQPPLEHSPDKKLPSIPLQSAEESSSPVSPFPPSNPAPSTSTETPSPHYLHDQYHQLVDHRHHEQQHQPRSRVTSHTAFEGYSGQNKIPTIQDYKESVEKREHLAETQNNSSSSTAILDGPRTSNESTESRQQRPGTSLASSQGSLSKKKSNISNHKAGAEPSQGQLEKEELMRRMQSKGRPIDNVTKKGERVVHDPVTQQDVLIKDSDFKDFEKEENDNKSARKTSPSHIKPSNILLQSFGPPVQQTSTEALSKSFDSLSLVFGGGIALLWFFTAFGHGLFRFFFITTLCTSLGVGSWFALGTWYRRIEKDIERMRHDLHRQRGEQFSVPTPESAEWMNAYIKVFWGLINAEEMFKAVVDMIEDVMQASLPGFVDSVKISDVGQGTNPIRIVSIRGLPDQPGDKDYPREEWIDQKDSGDDAKNTSSDGEGASDDGKDGELTDQSGDYVNMEVSFVYQALPGQASQLRQSNIHLLVQFFLGLYDWLHIPVPIWIQVEGIAGTARIRLQMIEQAPYVRNLTFTLMGVPNVDVAAIPMSSKLPNVLDLPLVSSFVKSSIAAATAEYCAPKSMTLNLQEILTGSGIKMDTKATGIFVVTIHHSEDISVQDAGGSSDPYIVVAYAKFGKPLYSTRIIFEDLNPVFEETAFLLLDQDSIESDEDLSLTLWDNDKRSADDLIGRVQVPVRELMRRRNRMHKRTDPLKGFEDADSMKGHLTWSVGYFDKVPPNRALYIKPNDPTQQSSDPESPTKDKAALETTPEAAADKPLLNPAQEESSLPPYSTSNQSEKSNTKSEHDNISTISNNDNLANTTEKEKNQQKATAVDPNDDISVLNTRPDPKYPSGILSVVIHQINNLEKQNLKGATGSAREGSAGQDTDEPSEQAGNLPSSYCEVIINDDMVYKTRVKQYTSMPYFEAGTEKFVRDWTTAVVRVVVRDARLREHDPVLGIVNLSLRGLFSKSAEVTRLFAIQEGVGFGRANISFLWRSVKLKLDRNVLGWDTGTVQITSPITVTMSAGSEESLDALLKKKLKVWTSDVDITLPSKSAKRVDNGVVWELQENQCRFPLYRRHHSVMTLEIGGKDGVISVLGSKPKSIAVLWLMNLIDNEEKLVELDLIVADDPDDLRQNAINDFTAKHHKYQTIGKVSFSVLLDSGLDPDHEAIANRRGQASRHTFDAYDRIEGQAVLAERNSHANDDGVIDKHEQKEIRRAHNRALALRHRGPMQFAPYRSGLWIKDGIKARGARLRRSIGGRSNHEEKIDSEC